MGNGPIQPQMQPQQQPGAVNQGMGDAPQAMPGPPPQGANPATASPQPDADMGTFGADQSTDQTQQILNYIDFAMQDMNLAKKLNKKKDGKDTLREMGDKVVEGFLVDEDSRKGWMDRNAEWMKLALLVREDKSFPWPKAANVKYPLLATAAMQFSARAYPALVPTDGHIVKTKIVQMHPDDKIYQAAERIGQHMSYQLLERMPDWEEDMDKLLMTMAISGICFKETVHNGLLGVHQSNLIYPESFVVNYHAKSLEKAYRKTKILYYTDNEVLEKVNNEEFLELDLSAPVTEPESKDKNAATGITAPPTDKSTPHKFISMHTFWDLDDDGYEEPYVITVHVATKQVVRIIARWCQDGVHKNDKGDIVLIEPLEYFTSFPFIPNPDGSLYALGFGLLLGPLNEAVNSLANQLIDSGTLNNLSSGFIGKGLRLRMGQTSLQPGEFKVVNATAEDLQKGVFVMPTKEPSNVLFQLMNMLITSGNQLASIAEIFVGKMPGQNTPATTTQETVQQGMAVFTAIYKRVYRSLAKEFKKIYRLNQITPGIVEEEGKLAGMELQASDYDMPEWCIVPGADPSGDSATVKRQKMQTVGTLLSLGTIDPMIYTRFVLDAEEIPFAQQLMRQPQPAPPDPKVALLQQQGKQDAETHQMDMQSKQQDVQSKAQLASIEMERLKAKAAHEDTLRAIKEQGMQWDAKHDLLKQTMDQHAEKQSQILELLIAQAKNQQALVHTQQDHTQGMVHTQQTHQQTLTLAAQKARQEKKAAASPK